MNMRPPLEGVVEAGRSPRSQNGTSTSSGPFVRVGVFGPADVVWRRVRSYPLGKLPGDAP